MDCLPMFFSPTGQLLTIRGQQRVQLGNITFPGPPVVTLTNVIIDYLYGNVVTVAPIGSGTTDVTVTAKISGLTTNTVYQFRAYAANAAGSVPVDPTTIGNVFFTTSSALPTVSTGAATNTTASGATLNGMIFPNGLNAFAYFEYGPALTAGGSASTTYGGYSNLTNVGSGNAFVNVSIPVSALTANTLYHARLVGVNDAGATKGSDTLFLSSSPTQGIAPTVFTGAATNTSVSGATLNGTVAPNQLDTFVYFEYGPALDSSGIAIRSDVYGSLSAPVGVGSGNGFVPISIPITGLTANTLYKARISG